MSGAPQSSAEVPGERPKVAAFFDPDEHRLRQFARAGFAMACLLVGAAVLPVVREVVYPYAYLVEASGGYSHQYVYSAANGVILDFCQWSLVLVVFAWTARRLKAGVLVPLAPVAVAAVAVGVQVMERWQDRGIAIADTFSNARGADPDPLLGPIVLCGTLIAHLVFLGLLDFRGPKGAVNSG